MGYRRPRNRRSVLPLRTSGKPAARLVTTQAPTPTPPRSEIDGILAFDGGLNCCAAVLHLLEYTCPVQDSTKGDLIRSYLVVPWARVRGLAVHEVS